MKRLIFIFFILSSLFSYAQVDTKPVNPEFYPLQTPNNVSWYWNPIDSSLWEFHGGKWQHLASHTEMIELLEKKEDTLSFFEIEITATGENQHTLPFSLRPKSLVWFNGVLIKEEEWGGVGTPIISLNFDVRKYDVLKIQN